MLAETAERVETVKPQEQVSPHFQQETERQYIFEARNIRKEFPGVVALDNVELKVSPGRVLALMGENGAGKSTLMKIISGVYTPDAGALSLRGQPYNIKGPLDALEQGVAMIHQELNLMPFMTVAENIWIRREPLNTFGFVDHQRMYQQTRELFEALKIELDPRAEVRDLSVANRQMVEIAKAVSYDSEVLIMDEPTSALTEREVERLFSIIADLKAKGTGIVYITHKMDEVFTIADDIAVFRDGQHIGTDLASKLDREALIKMMVGREITQMFPKEEAEIGETVLAVKNLGLDGYFQDVSFELRAGEILGLAGLVGAGRTNLAETLFGVTPATQGTIELHGQEVVISQPHQAMEQGVALLTEDRKETGCFLQLSVLQNMEMAVLTDSYVEKGFVQQQQVNELCEEMKQLLKIKTPDLDETIGNLSGGNQQKALIARWLMTKPRILILDEPTRGIDVGAKAEIHRLISSLAAKGLAVLMISSELPEILGMSDRVMVMHEGAVTGILERNEASQVAVMKLASA
ncbi:sugar ABC transporter ATP-binding protein [Endozoicomonadaceae bacterium StTr2]